MTTAEEHVAPSLRGLHLKPGYDSSDQILDTFYIPALSRAVRYDRSVGYFRSSALSVAARGLSRFISGGGTLRLLCGVEVSAADRDALSGRTSLDGAFAERLAAGLATENEIDRRRLEVLAWLTRAGRLEVRIAVAVDERGLPVVTEGDSPYFHEKIGVLWDAGGDGVAFQGSVNESATGWTRNFESFSVYASWELTAGHFAFWANKFEEHWAGRIAGFRVFPLPEAARDSLLHLAPEHEPGLRDPEEPPAVGDDQLVARFLQVAPHLVGADGLAEATAGVSLFPHQRQVVERLAGLYPRSWLVADEVGLGKTISAGMALRRLLLSGEVQRALILAPANVCRQWQDELFEKFGLWIPRLDRGQIHGAHPEEVGPVAPGANPYAEHPVLIASSHLARRRAQQDLILAAAPFDLIVVDEAHHARRRSIDADEYRPGRLLQLLDRLRESAATKATWLLSATPMQLSSLELLDLLCHVGLAGPLSSHANFVCYHRELAKSELSRVDWDWLARMLRETPRLPLTGAEETVLKEIGRQRGQVDAAIVSSFGLDRPGRETADQLHDESLASLREWLVAIGPVARHLTRHSRTTLQHYRAVGLLREKLARREVEPRLVPFTTEERELYEDLDGLIDRLLAAHGSRRGAGFVLTVYRRRLTSSWAAIRKTLARRLDMSALELEEDLLEEAEGAELEVDVPIDDASVLPLSPDDLIEIRTYLERAARVPDSKFDQLCRDIDEARSAGHSTIVFTQYTDTLDDLRDRLSPAYRSQLATFSGSGGKVFREVDGWVDIAKRDLVEAIRSGQVTVLLATDAASEGLNLQACSYLVNYDMPWNPMRVEQRIGRIDRLGQARDVVHVRNYFIPGTVEEAVYNALSKRIDSFRALLGNLQPVLGATERAFQTIFRAPRSERAAAEKAAIGNLMGEIDALEHDAIRFDDEDRFPIKEPAPAPVTLDMLREVIVERFGATLDDPSRPVTWVSEDASRDVEGWAALATYGHPRLEAVLASHAGPSMPSGSSLALAEVDGIVAAARADRSPPELVASLRDIDELGPASARGEAETLARTTARTRAETRREYQALIASLRSHQQAAALRAEFIALLRAVIAASCRSGSADGEGDIGPLMAWYELTTRRESPWTYLEAFRGRLEVPVAQLLPPRPAGSTSQEGARRDLMLRSAARRLALLMERYQLANRHG